MKSIRVNAEQERLVESGSGTPWKKWGPYLSEREWGTVREDYSESGDAWNYFTHDHARSRAYRWGEDGLRPTLRQLAWEESGGIVALSHRALGERFFSAEGTSSLLFTENETNTQRLVGMPNRFPYVKDGINNYIVHGKKEAIKCWSWSLSRGMSLEPLFW